MIKVSPSLLSSSLIDLKSELLLLKSCNADYAHVDCMDGHFVNNMAFGPSFVKQLYETNIIDLDVHLMIDNPLKFVDSYVDYSYILTIHEEVIDEETFFKIEKKVHGKHKLLGLSFRPNTDVNNLIKYLPYVDVILIMSVMPGFSGQKFMDSIYSSLEFLNLYRKNKGLNYLIEVDGGVDDTNYQKLIDNGVDILVSGSYLFKGEMKEKIELMKGYKG